MTRFRYQARDTNGKLYKGIVESQDKHQAARILREKDLYPVGLKDESGGPFQKANEALTRRVKFGDLVLFTRQLSTMFTAGLQLTDALSLLRRQLSSRFGEVIADLQTSIEGGSSLSDAMAKHGDVFTSVYIALVKTGESSGLLDEVLTRLADNLEKEQEFRSKVKGAMIYPMIIIVGMVLVIIVMMVFVIPKMTQLYQDFGATLPMPTQILINFSNLISNFWWLWLLLSMGFLYGYQAYYKTNTGRHHLDSFYLRLPILGGLNKTMIMTEFTRTMSLLISAGVSMIEALNIVAKAMGNILFEDGVKSASTQVEKGFPLAYALAQTEVFPPIVTQMVSVGEETGKVGEVLGKLSRYFESESENLVKGLTSAIEPLIIIVLGVGVAFLVVAIIMPIYSLTSQFSP
ncbi:MAG: hypothetical protein UW86_C0001G0039 [Microgenomates group bacterium GW2011_GWA1_Microgenomates_45_10]|nr:MAG: hypothetical protein UW69_C0003G0004 [Microgenomates group bacterium GW2011_GWA2_44_7]KKT87486.1 MAG: hypothetical protein UW86_C0001G0039 [Microgenomates group bacterium GW2011_GWA1_Microgenomates_45_10]